PGEQLRRAPPGPPSHRTDRLGARLALGDDRGLYLRRPVPPLASAREDLEPLNSAGASIVTRHRHSTSALPPDQGAETRRCASHSQGGARTPLTLKRFHEKLDELDVALTDNAVRSQAAELIG